ncbi:pentapeptide repeat-containing protein [Streptomyces sp. NPDC059866]|uniref:pentapeptide repeat-containing protein n=1 Tax=Streptomyces sp. NPDC059866 TaxID=3346978 RepID=UPI00366371F1
MEILVRVALGEGRLRHAPLVLVPQRRRRFVLWPISCVAPVALIPALVLGWAVYRYVSSVLTGVGTALVLFSVFLAVVYAYRRRRVARWAPQGRYAPDLLPVWLVALLAVALALLLGRVIYQMALDYFEREAAAQKLTKPVNINDVLKATVTVLTLTGAVLAGVYAYRKQLVAEGDAHRADASQLAERYATAAEQLGHDRAAVRLAGAYALARLADDWQEQRQVCIDVLCAYLRMPYETETTAAGYKEGEREVRHTIIRVIRDHLRDPDASASWCPYSFDFTGATFDGGDLSDSHFQHSASFDGAKFKGRTVAFNFTGTRFHEGTVTFHKAEFGGTVFFNRAQFDGGTVGFLGAEFRGARVNFLGAKFRGTHIIFKHADFGGGTVAFHTAEFSGGTVDFHRAKFGGGTVGFRDAEFSGSTVTFDNAEFGSGAIVTFDDAHFQDGVVTFDGDTRLEPGAAVTFEGAEFGGTRIAWGPLPRPAGH